MCNGTTGMRGLLAFPCFAVSESKVDHLLTVTATAAKITSLAAAVIKRTVIYLVAYSARSLIAPMAAIITWMGCW